MNPINISPRNKTIYITSENQDYEGALMYEQEHYSVNEVVGKTICADLFKIVDALPKEFADLIIIDPPYNLSKSFNGLNFKASSSVEYYEYIKSWFGRVCRLLKPDGSLYMCGDWRSTAVMQQVLEEELVIQNRITWQREKGRGAAANWKNSMEDIWFAVKDPKNYYFDIDAVKIKRKVIAPYRVDGKPKDWVEEKTGNFRMTHPSNFWDDITVPYWSMPENTEHPTQKPEKLIAKLILASSPVGGIVFDPFLGSGTTSVVAQKLGRKFCGVEINKEYALIAQKRLTMASSDKTIQGYADGVFWERNSLATAKKQNNDLMLF